MTRCSIDVQYQEPILFCLTGCSISRLHPTLPDWVFNIKTPPHFAPVGVNTKTPSYSAQVGVQYQHSIPLCTSGCPISRLHPTLTEWVFNTKAPSHFARVRVQYQEPISLHMTGWSISRLHPVAYDWAFSIKTPSRCTTGHSISRVHPTLHDRVT